MKLFFREYGKGQPLIILHGIFGISDNWVSFARSVEDRFRVFIPDQRNHGQSPHDPTFNYYALCADLYDFIDEHELEHPIVLGHSMGGKVAMRFALENPDILKALVVADISMRSYQRRFRHLDMIDAMMSVDFNNAQTREDVEKQIEPRIRDSRIRQFAMKNLYRRERSGEFAWRLNLEAINLNMDEVFEGIASDALYQKPTLFIRGGASDYIKYEDFDQIYRNFPKADIKTIEGAGHWLHAEKPNEFKYFFDEFILKNELLEG
ncbi:MAG: alpha/beta fold hydrolase [Bacteroidales bacterium]|nr:alpha/beta fold hydrolase [Bacteroidales bacterium]